MRSSRPFQLAAAAMLVTLGHATPALAANAVEARLISVEGDIVKLDKGREQGVAVGQIFDLYRDAQVFKLPLTRGEVPLVQSQERVARVVIIDCEPSTSRGNIIVREPNGTGGEQALDRGLIALMNPLAVAPNRVPSFLAAPAPAAAPWRGRVELRLAVSNESDEAMVYTWRTTAGVLDHERTLLPVNTWTAPPLAGSARITVEVRDGAGNVARTAFTAQSEGIRGRPGQLRVGARVLGASRYPAVRDVAFDRIRDRASRRYILTPKTGTFGGTDAAVVVEAPESDKAWQARMAAGEHDFQAIAASSPGPGVPGAMYGLDRKTRTVLRFPFGREWAQVLKQAPVVIGEPDGGTGNARFQDPVDLALSQDGEVYVLDAGQKAVQAFNAQGSFLVSFGRPGTRALELQTPRALAVGPDSAVYVLDDGRKTVVVFRGWRAVSEIAVGGPDEELVGVAVDPFTSGLYVLERSTGAIKSFSSDGRLIGTHKAADPTSASALVKPTRLRMEPTRVLWVVDQDGLALARFGADLSFIGRTGATELPSQTRIAALPGGGVAALDKGEKRVTVFDAEGWITARFGSAGSRPQDLQDPVDLGVNAAGDVFVLDAERNQLLRFSPQGAFLDAAGRGGEGPRELMNVMDVTSVNDRSYLVVSQQRPQGNFNLLDAATGQTERAHGELAGDQTPRFGCVTGVTGRLDGRRDGADGRHSDRPWFWFADDDKEKVYRMQYPAVTGVPLDLTFDEVTDMEAMPTGHVAVCDGGDARVVILNQDGSVLVGVPAGERLEAPFDVGADDYGRVWVFDSKRRRIVDLTD